MLALRNKIQVVPSVYNNEKNESFQKALYTNANIFRIVLHKPVREKIAFNKWYRIDMKLVTEMGLTTDRHALPIQVNCNVLYNNKFGEGRFKIQTRPVTEDAWDPEVAKSEGFNPYNAIGGIEYKIDQGEIDKPFYISLFANKRKDILPLTVGPFFINNESGIEGWQETNEKMNELEGQQYRTLASSLSDNTCFLLKEQWDFGTPGKIWDSAIVMTNVLLGVCQLDPTYLSNKRVLDLSAGTGYIGLSIAQYYQNRPQHQSPYIVLTDLKEALNLIDQNRKLNNIEQSNHLEITPLSWGDKAEANNIIRDNNELDIIIASDVLYNVAHFPSLISTFLHLSNKNTIIYFGYKQRGLTYEEETMFFDQCKQFFDTTKIVHIQGQVIQSDTPVQIYKMQLHQAKNQFYTLPFLKQLLLKINW
ncbi:unnamed protein product [Mucor hiemalis]